MSHYFVQKVYEKRFSGVNPEDIKWIQKQFNPHKFPVLTTMWIVRITGNFKQFSKVGSRQQIICWKNRVLGTELPQNLCLGTWNLAKNCKNWTWKCYLKNKHMSGVSGPEKALEMEDLQTEKKWPEKGCLEGGTDTYTSQCDCPPPCKNLSPIPAPIAYQTFFRRILLPELSVASSYPHWMSV